MAERPNFLFFFTDDQRFDTIRALGNPHISTPNLDWLVANGTVFTDAYIMGGTSGAVCMPSRAMLWTGRTLFHIEGQGQAIPSEHTLLGEALQAGDYTVFGAGKWHNGPAAYARNFNRGAEIFFGGMDDHWNVPACDYDPAGVYGQRIQQTVDFVQQRVVEKVADHIHAGRHSSVLFCDAARDFLRSEDARDPFFVSVCFMAPHDPRTMPREYLALYDPAQPPLPENFLPEHPFDNGQLEVRDELLAGLPRDPAEIRRHLAAYYGMISHLDAQIGRVLDTLRETGQLDNTVIILAGDNGLALGRHGLMGKQNLYEHSIHVPLLMCGPGIPQGVRRAAPVYLSDIYPTVCELAGLAVPASVEGASLVPALRDAAYEPHGHMLYAYRHLQRAVREGRHKLIEYAVNGQRTTQLFDLQADPFEMHNLAGDPAYTGVLARLRQALSRWRDELGDTQEGMGRLFWQTYDTEE
jgi:arylsulfatase A-like enzyme